MPAYVLGQSTGKAMQWPKPKIIKSESGQTYTYTKVSDKFGFIDIRYQDGTRKRQEAIIELDTIFVPSGLVIGMDSVGRIMTMYSLYNGKVDGKMVRFYENEMHVKSITNVIRGKMHGLYREFYENGIASVAGHMSEKGRIGTWYFYYPTGVIKEYGRYKAFKIRKRNLNEFSNYMDSWIGDKYVYLKDGEWRKYSSNGKETERCVFHRGKCEATSTKRPK